MGSLAGSLAHDFNNLLTVMRGFTELFIATLDPVAPSRQHADEVLKAAKQASGLTQQLLTFNREQVVELRAVNLNDLVSNIEKILRQLIGKDVALFTNLDQGFGQVKGPRLTLMASQVSDAFNTKTRVNADTVWNGAFLPPQAALDLLPKK